MVTRPASPHRADESPPIQQDGGEVDGGCFLRIRHLLFITIPSCLVERVKREPLGEEPSPLVALPKEEGIYFSNH